MTDEPTATPEPNHLPKATASTELVQSAATASSVATTSMVTDSKVIWGFVAWLRSLSLLETLCCVVILLSLLGFAATVFVPALYDVPPQPELMVADDFPLEGVGLQVNSAETYWREPISEGPDADRVRSGTVLVPVLKAQVSGAAQVRVLFRDGRGELMGDVQSLDLSADQNYSATSTAGFNQQGDFTAYQAGEIEPWVVEFHEIPAGVDGTSEETVLFRMNISPIQKKK